MSGTTHEERMVDDDETVAPARQLRTPMTEPQRPLTTRPQDVFRRSNMPSRWERIAGVSPKTVTDRKYLAFVAARYRGDERLRHPDSLAVPVEVQIRRVTLWGGSIAATMATVLGLAGAGRHATAIMAVSAVIAVCALAVMMVVSMWAGPVIQQFNDIQSRSARAASRLRADPMDRADTDTINEMIACDEGTLTYCAAKIASEIEQDPAWQQHAVGFVAIDLWNELAEVSASARQIADDREATAALLRSRLREDPDMRAVLEEDKLQRREALALLAARVHAFADYRDRIHTISVTTRRERTALDRVVRQVADDQARDRLR
jgi:hypothetical protein